MILRDIRSSIVNAWASGFIAGAEPRPSIKAEVSKWISGCGCDAPRLSPSLVPFLFVFPFVRRANERAFLGFCWPSASPWCEMTRAREVMGRVRWLVMLQKFPVSHAISGSYVVFALNAHFCVDVDSFFYFISCVMCGGVWSMTGNGMIKVDLFA